MLNKISAVTVAFVILMGVSSALMPHTAFAQSTPFICDDANFISQGTGSSTGLYLVDYSTNPFGLNLIDAPEAFQYNAIGYNIIDGEIYGIVRSDTGGYASGQIVSIDAAGNITNYGASVPSTNSFSGDIDEDGLYYTFQSNKLIVFDTQGATFPANGVQYNLSQSFGADAAYNPIDGLIYSVVSRNLRILDPADLSGSGTIPVTSIPITTVNSNTNLSSAGGMWVDALGRIYAYQNQGQIYVVTSSGEATFVSTAPRVGINDGTGCAYAPLIEKSVSPASSMPGDTITYEIVMANGLRSTSLDLNLLDGLPDGLTWVAGTYAISGDLENSGTTNGYGGTKNLEVNGITIQSAGVVTVTIDAVSTLDTMPGIYENQAIMDEILDSLGGSKNSDWPDGPAKGEPTPHEIVAAIELTIDKTFSGYVDHDSDSTISIGDDLNYTFVISNSGDVNMYNVVMNDPLVTDLTCSVPQPRMLAPGESYSCTATYQSVTQENIDDGYVENRAQVSGDDPSGAPHTNEDIEHVEIDQISTAELAKSFISSNGDPKIIAKDDLLTYGFVFTNTGNVTLENAQITDPLSGLSALDCTPSQPTTLLPGEAISCTATYEVTQADVDFGEIKNSGTGAGTDPEGDEVSDSDTVTVPPRQLPDIEITKAMSGYSDNDDNGLISLDDLLTYTFIVTNTGNTTLNSVAVTDPLPSLSPIDCTPAQPADGVPPAGMLNCTATYVVTQADMDKGTIDNRATATAESPIGEAVEDKATETVPLVQIAEIELDKQVNPSSGYLLNETITYTFVATNTGNVTLDNVIISDPLPNLSSLSCDQTMPLDDFIPGEVLTCTATYTATQIDVDTGTLSNTATVTGDAPNDTEVSDEDSETTTAAQMPSIDLIKIAEPKTGLLLGDIITYTLTATNTGNVTLDNVTITDSRPGLSPIVCNQMIPANDFSPLESLICTATYAVTQADVDAGIIPNMAIASGEAPDSTTVADEDQESALTEQNPAIEATKTADAGGLSSPVAAGDVITYTITVDNPGNQTLSNITLLDTLIDGDGTVLALTSGPTYISGDGNLDNNLDVTETWRYQASFALTQPVIDSGGITNTVVVSATIPNGESISDLADDGNDDDGNTINDPTETVLTPTPSIEVVKIADTSDLSSPVTAGDTIQYSIIVSNSGNVTLNSVVLTDTLTAANGASLSLTTAPTYVSGDGNENNNLDVNEQWQYTASYTLSQAAINAGGVSNTISAAARSPKGVPATDVSDDGDDSDGNVASDPTETLLAAEPRLELIKTSAIDMTIAGEPTRAEPGDVVNYTFSVANTGNVDLSNVTINDPVIGTVTGGPIALPVGANDSTTFSGSIVLTSDIIAQGGITNTAMAIGTRPDGGLVSDVSDDPNNDAGSDDSTFTPIVIDSEMVVAKSSRALDLDGDGMIEPGETISYTFVVENSGNVDLYNVTISDPLLSAPNGMIIGGPIPLLEVGRSDSTTFTGLYAIQPQDMAAGFVRNTATVFASDPNANSVSSLSDDPNDPANASDDDGDGNPDDPTTTLLPAMPSIELVKRATFNDNILADGEASPGETVTYNFTITNTGNVSLTNVMINDSLVTVEGGPIELGAGAVDNLSFTALYTLTSTDIATGGITNTATVEGTAPDGTKVSDVSDEGETVNGNDNPTVLPLTPRPELTLEKYGTWIDENGNGTAEIDEAIVYSFTVRNTGNVDIANITITDPIVTVSGGPIGLLPAGAVDTNTFSAIYRITSADITAGNVTNQATATGTDPNGAPLSDISDDPTSPPADSPTVTPLLAEPSIELLKSAMFNDLDGDGMAEAGETVTYSFTVRNTGNINLFNMSVTDSLITVNGGPIDELAAGAMDTQTFWGVYTLTQVDIVNGGVTNTATVNTEDGNGTPIADTSDDPQNPTDSDTDLNGDPDDPTELTIAKVPNLALSKQATFNDENGDGIAQPGETISYSFIVRNTGNVDLTNVTITDELVAITGGPIALFPVGAVDDNTFSASYILSSADIAAGGVTNEALVSATSPDGNTVIQSSDDPLNANNVDDDNDGQPDDPTITLLMPLPEIELIKVATFIDENGDGVAQPGETIAYAFTVSNVGNVDLFNVSVSDAMVTLIGDPIAHLPAGAVDSTTFTAIHRLTSDDIASRGKVNTALVSAEASSGGTVVDTSDDPIAQTDADPNGDGNPDDPTAIILLPAPAISLQKVGTFVDENGDGYVQVGETITYSFTVENIGNVDLNNVMINDPMAMLMGGPISTLAVGEIDSSSIRGVYTVTQADIERGSVTNTARVDARDPNGNPISDLSDDPSNPDNVDIGNDGNPDDATVTQLSEPLTSFTSAVWNDQNGNGIRDADEAGVPDVTVLLYDANNNQVNSTTTNADGSFSFQAPPGDYTLRVVAPDGFMITDISTSGGFRNVANQDGFWSISIRPGENILDVGVGLIQTPTDLDEIGEPTALDEIAEPGSLVPMIYMPVIQ